MRGRYVCKAYTDKARPLRWPTEFWFPPRVGDYVESECGYKMQVATITHSTRFNNDVEYREPYVIVELTPITP